MPNESLKLMHNRCYLCFLLQDSPVRLQGVLATLIKRHASEGQTQASPAGASGLNVQNFLQMCFAVHSQIVLARVFDDIPLAIRMFFVQKVQSLLAGMWHGFQYALHHLWYTHTHGRAATCCMSKTW